MLIGAGLKFALIDRIARVANDAYRERFVIEKSGVRHTSGLSYQPFCAPPTTLCRLPGCVRRGKPQDASIP